jgi:hypothetical protein
MPHCSSRTLRTPAMGARASAYPTSRCSTLKYTWSPVLTLSISLLQVSGEKTSRSLRFATKAIVNSTRQASSMSLFSSAREMKFHRHKAVTSGGTRRQRRTPTPQCPRVCTACLFSCCSRTVVVYMFFIINTQCFAHIMLPESLNPRVPARPVNPYGYGWPEKTHG